MDRCVTYVSDPATDYWFYSPLSSGQVAWQYLSNLGSKAHWSLQSKERALRLAGNRVIDASKPLLEASDLSPRHPRMEDGFPGPGFSTFIPLPPSHLSERVTLELGLISWIAIAGALDDSVCNVALTLCQLSVGKVWPQLSVALTETDLVRQRTKCRRILQAQCGAPSIGVHAVNEILWLRNEFLHGSYPDAYIEASSRTVFFALNEKHITSIGDWYEHKVGPQRCGWFTLPFAGSLVGRQTASYVNWFAEKSSAQAALLT